MDLDLTSWLAVAPGCFAAVASLAIAYFLRAGKYRPLTFRPWQNGLLALSAVGALLFTSWWVGLREPLPPVPSSADGPFVQVGRQVPPSGWVYDEAGLIPLAVGGHFPPLLAKGWLNGPAVLPAESASGITVIDVWNEICSVCHEAAPGLLRVHAKYAARGVNFLGLTARSKNDAAAFVELHGIAWPNGYEVEALYDSAPQVFIVGRDGTIIWFDERLRLRHEPERLIRELDQAIERTLSADDDTGV